MADLEGRGMDRTVLDKCREELQRLMDEVQAGAGKTVSDMTTIPEENFPDPTDRALLESNRNFTLRLRDRERKLLAKIKEAMKRVDDGTFGVCEGCDGKISEKRLVARPVTTLCIDCKTVAEEEEGR
ncbi:MAG: RNA polymerase-binding protein DksA [Candidatus Deferrimicrobiaceae bacterium]